ncbi:MAG TPA: NAD(P)H-dependent glycerol-3-phosphate dehydrogenase [Pseudomonadales bacterium]
MTASVRVAVIGGGSFGTAIANIVAENGHEAWLWMRNADRATEINTHHSNNEYLPGYALSPQLRATLDLAEAVSGSDVIFMAVPSSSCRDVAKQVAQYIDDNVLVVSLTKGIEPSGFRLMSEIIEEEMPGVRLGVLSGPNLAREIASRQLTGSVIASADVELCNAIQTLLHCAYFRVYDSTDRYGVELGGALKNIYAMMAGMGAALGLGQNTQAMLMTRSLAEMSRFAVRLGANPLTFLGLAGVGDLIVTCMSPLSRNYRVGYALGEGKPLDDVLADMDQVAEGINTLKLVRDKAAELDVYMPLADGLYEILYNHRAIADVVGDLMGSEQNIDVEFVLPGGLQ